MSGIELENTGGSAKAEIEAAIEALRERGTNLNDVEAIWFQSGKAVELEMKDGTRKTIE